jgi:(R,R)-butanediol dehydrogenase / meso-butanediol dehydrogenase / diacetyl reductase
MTSDHSMAVVSIDRPAPAAGEVLLNVSYCGICGSDLHMLSAPDLFPPRHVLGHEFTGVVAQLGPHADGWAVGDRVAVHPILTCGECQECRTGHPNLCQQEGINNGPGIGRQGAYAESIAVPAGMLRRLPAMISDADAALIEPLAVAVRAVKVSGATPDEPVCVLGAALSSTNRKPYSLTGKPRFTPPWLGSSQREVTAFPRV